MFHIKYSITYTERLNEAKNNKLVQRYLELAVLLQDDILGGNLNFSKDETDLFRDLIFEMGKNEKIILDIPVVSSMVKGLSPLVLYLGYIAKPDDLLVIDEPEMNLHPEAQVKLTEFLAMLVNAGLNVLITTHSAYLVDHLVNLMKAATLDNQEEVADKFYLRHKEAFISQDKVSIYLFENNTAKNILDKEGFIDWNTFSNVSERISHIYFDI